MSREINSPEERCEDPLVMSLDTVIGDDGIVTTAAGDADKLSGRIRRTVFAARRGIGLSDIENVSNRRQRPTSGINKGLVGRVDGSSGVSHHGALKLNERRVGPLN